MELHDDDNWEVVNDDGLVYKRLKRPPVDPITTAAPPPDAAAEERIRKERKKTMLLKLKTKYQQEIHHWELLSNTLKAFQERTQTQPPPALLPDQPLALPTDHFSDSTYREILENLLLQVEAQEAHLNEVSKLCDVAEAVCNAQERQLLKQAFVYLPIWESSPRKLITSLCEV